MTKRFWGIVTATATAALMLTGQVHAETFFVSPTGDDVNPGTAAKPFRTLAAACRAVPSGKNTIRLEAGLYPETETSKVPSGVSVTGAGQDKTILRWGATRDLDKNPWDIAPDSFLMQVTDSADAALSGFTIEGKLDGENRAHGGILAYKVTNFEIRDITARSFRFSALYLAEGVNSRLHHCRVEDSGNPNKQSCSGGIQFGDLTDSAIHDNVIRENRGGYAMKSWRYLWSVAMKGPRPDARIKIKLLRTKFYNNDVKVRQQGGWGSGQPNMALELWNCQPTECEIYGNRFNECVSLTGDFSAPKTIRVHHNDFTLEKGYSYAIEVSTDNVEIDHNYFANGYYPLACFGSRREGIYVHDNIFDGIEKIQLMYFRNGVKNFRFVNNTVHLKETFPILVLSGRVSENVTIANNLFYKEGAEHAPELVLLRPPKDKPQQQATIAEGTLTVRNNAFYNWKPEGDAAFTGDPILVKNGKRENGAYFRLAPKSPLRALGIGADWEKK
jgi:nitrous oxidase accessory protein NosD